MNTAKEFPEGPIRRTVVLAGATGLVGRAILERLLADTSIRSVHVLTRRDPGVADSRLTCHIVDFVALPLLPPVDEVYLALGTTIKVAGSAGALPKPEGSSCQDAGGGGVAGASGWKMNI
jgi:Male sterility protein